MNRHVALASCLALALAATAPVLAETAKFSLTVVRDSGIPVAGASITVTPSGQAAINLTSDARGEASCDVPRAVSFTSLVSASGLASCKFTRTLGKNDDWGQAKVVLPLPRNGEGRVSEWRVGRTSNLENPEKDYARFNFYVKYYRTKAAISGATLTVTKKDGTLVKTLTTDAKGYATLLVAEGTQLNVKASAAGYVDYSTLLSPGTKATTRDVNILMKKSI